MAKRQFDLEKRPKRHFDLDKHTADEEPAFTTTKAPETAKKASDTVADAALETAVEQQEQVRSSNRLASWVIVLAVIVIAALIAWFVWPSNSSEDEEPMVAQTEQAEAEEQDGGGNTPEAVADEEPAQPAEAVAAEVAAGEAGAVPQPAAAAPAPQPAPNATATANAGTAPTADTETEANNVIRGIYGNNPDRRARLGERYHEIQARVNALMEASEYD